MQYETCIDVHYKSHYVVHKHIHSLELPSIPPAVLKLFGDFTFGKLAIFPRES